MSFELFTETGARTQEFISVTETKTFGLSRAFLDKYGITAEQKAVILYDTDTNSVGLSFSDKNPKFGFAVRIANPKHGGAIVAKSFFEVKGIDAKKYAGRYSDFSKKPLSSIGIDNQGEVFVFTLKERVPVEEPDEPPMAAPDDEPINLDDIPF